jgi:hypothetical protein
MATEAERVQSMRRKWASCSSRGVVSFSTDLLQQDLDFVQAVVVHELVHLAVPNHGPLFRSLVQAYLPGSQALISDEVRGRAHRFDADHLDESRYACGRRPPRSSPVGASQSETLRESRRAETTY